jgi:ribosomal protein L37E
VTANGEWASSVNPLYRKCDRCGETWYAHHDHQHSAACPFGDCGEFVEEVSRDR